MIRTRFPNLYREYRFLDAVEQQTSALLGGYPGVVMNSDRLFLMNIQNEREMVSLRIPLELMHQGALQFVIVEIYLNWDFPESAPIVYIRPIEGTEINRRNRFVEADGSYCLPEIAKWTKKASLLDLVFKMAENLSSFFPITVTVKSAPSNPEPPLKAKSPYAPEYDMGNRLQDHFKLPEKSDHAPNIYSNPPMNFNYQMNYNPQPPPQHYQPHLQNPQPYPQYHQPYDQQAAHRNRLISQLRQRAATIVHEEIRCLHDSMRTTQSSDAQLAQLVHQASWKKSEMAKTQAFVSNRIAQANSDSRRLERHLLEVQRFHDEPPSDRLMIPDGYYRQLFQSKSNYCALDDYMYALERALGAGVIKMDAYLKEVRRVSKEQYSEMATQLMLREKIKSARSIPSESRTPLPK